VAGGAPGVGVAALWLKVFAHNLSRPGLISGARSALGNG